MSFSFSGMLLFVCFPLYGYKAFGFCLVCELHFKLSAWILLQIKRPILFLSTCRLGIKNPRTVNYVIRIVKEIFTYVSAVDIYMGSASQL